MISALNRFTRRQFSAARKRMKSFRSGPFLFLYRDQEQSPSRFSVVVRKKTDKRATQRNQFKRQVYTAIGDQILPIHEHLQLICLHQGKTFDASSIDPAIQAFLSHYKTS